MCYEEIKGDDDDTKMYNYFQERFVVVSSEEYVNLDQDLEMHNSGQGATELHISCEHDSEDGSREDKNVVPHRMPKNAFIAF